MSSAALPTVTSPVAPDLRRYLDRLRDILGAKGTNKIITVSDLVAAGMVTANSDGSITPTTGAGGGTVAAPGSPSGLTATAAMRSILLEWDNPTYAGHAFTEVWGHSADVIGDAVLLGLAPGVLYTDSVGPGVHRYYWIRFINELGAAGPFNAVGGTDATTLPELTTLLDVLAEEYGTGSAAPFFQIDTPTVIGGVSIPAGTYMKAAFIHDAAIDNAKIADLAVDNAKIADLAADKITAGSMQVGSYVQSTNYTPGSVGWRIDADGTAELANAVVRGTVYATDGQFNGEVIAASPSGEMARMWSGNFEVYKNVPSAGLVKYNALSRIETGIATSGTAQAIPGYFRAQPKVIVSPLSLNTYDPGYPAQGQALRCEVLDLIESPAASMQWQFTPLATLNIASNTGWVAVGTTSGDTTSAWTSPASAATPVNTGAITAKVAVVSRHGLTGVYAYFNPNADPKDKVTSYSNARIVPRAVRAVRARVEYLSGATWMPGGWVSAVMPASDYSSLDLSAPVSPSPAGAYQARVVCEAADFSAVGDSAGWPALPPDNVLWGAATFAGPLTASSTRFTDPVTAIAYSGSTYCAVGIGGQICTSTDGENWVPRYTNAAHRFYDVIWANGLFIAVGGEENTVGSGELYIGLILSSPDGVTWTSRLRMSGNGFVSVSYSSAAGMFVAVANFRARHNLGLFNSRIVSSSDGTSWTLRASPAMAYTLRGVAWSGSTCIAVGSYTSGSTDYGAVFTSTGGTVWSMLVDNLPAPLLSVCSKAGGGFVAVAQGGAIRSSATGGSWATLTTVAGACAITPAPSSGYILLVPPASITCGVHTSADATSWTHVSTTAAWAAIETATRVLVSRVPYTWWHVYGNINSPPAARDAYTYAGHTYSLAGTSVLATGTVSWVAIGD
ncbi:MAG: hypothetical protein KBF28_05950 [Gemmatimonadales bacterium]|nr:hypothetical protein [Gemmatimonadales bacterium]